MALTITIEGKGIIANADALTDDTGGTGTGDWGEDGGGGLSLTTDVFLYGTSCIAGAYSNKSGYQYFDVGVNNELDFDVAGSEEGQHIYMWIHCPTIGLLETKANKGLAIRLGTSLNDYREYLIAGSDDANGWNGGWSCFVIDPTKAGSVTDTGSFDYGSIRYLGVWIDAAALAKGDNIFTDQIAVGFGLRVTGTSTTGWKDVVDYCTDYPNRAWGMFQEREGIYYIYGKTWVGDSGQAANTSFSDSGRVIQYGVSEYWYSGAWVTLADIDYSGVIVEDAAGFSTTFQDGVLVGTDSGRSGSSIIGNANHDVVMDFYGGNNASSVTKLYSTSFKDITGPVTFGNDPDFHIYSVAFEGCSQVDPVGAPVIRNTSFILTNDVGAALLWNENINIQSSTFIANTAGAAIEMPSSVGSPYAYNDLLFSGNTHDVNNSSGTPISINKNLGSNPTTYEGSTVTFLGVSVDTTITAKNIETKAVIQGAQVLIKVADGANFPYQDSVSITRVDSTAYVAHVAHGLATGNIVEIEGANQYEYNGVRQITVTGVDEYTYTVSGTPTTPATGTITSTTVIISNTTDSGGEVSDTREYEVHQPIIGRARKASGGTCYKTSPIEGTIDKDSGISIVTLMIPDD